MADNSGIEWTDATWNPIVGCSIVSPGCTNCYAMKMADRLSAMAPRPDGTGNPHLLHYVKTITRDPTKRGYDWSAPVWTGQVELAPDQIVLQPLKWRKPKRIFVNSMGDLFHESIPDEWILRVLDIVRRCSYDGGSNIGKIGHGAGEHTFQLLTKRAARMATFMKRLRFNPLADESRGILGVCLSDDGKQPLVMKNLWLGVSAERQQEADERIPHLLRTPAVIRFVSAEPLLGPIDFSAIAAPDKVEGEPWTFNCLHTGDYYNMVDDLGCNENGDGPYREHAIDWIIVGGESGPHARPMHPQWARDIRDQCAAAGVALFFKQWGEWAPSTPEAAAGNPRSGWRSLKAHPHVARAEELYPEAGAAFIERVGKKSAGRLLDGIEHNAFPNPQPSSQAQPPSDSRKESRAAAVSTQGEA